MVPQTSLQNSGWNCRPFGCKGLAPNDQEESEGSPAFHQDRQCRSSISPILTGRFSDTSQCSLDFNSFFGSAAYASFAPSIYICIFHSASSIMILIFDLNNLICSNTSDFSNPKIQRIYY